MQPPSWGSILVLHLALALLVEGESPLRTRDLYLHDTGLTLTRVSRRIAVRWSISVLFETGEALDAIDMRQRQMPGPWAVDEWRPVLGPNSSSSWAGGYHFGQGVAVFGPRLQAGFDDEPVGAAPVLHHGQYARISVEDSTAASASPWVLRLSLFPFAIEYPGNVASQWSPEACKVVRPTRVGLTRYKLASSGPGTNTEGRIWCVCVCLRVCMCVKLARKGCFR